MHQVHYKLRKIVIVFLLFTYASGQLLSNKEHRTQAASERTNDLWCYQCDTMEDGDKCIDLNGNRSNLVKKCKDDGRICMVKRVSHTMATENSTSVLKMWSLERTCTKLCESGCIVIGERIKLYECTSCCEKSYCNVDRGTSSLTFTTSNMFIIFCTMLQIVSNFCLIL